MKLAILLVLFASWTLIQAQNSPSDRVYCNDEYPDGTSICPPIYDPVCGNVQVQEVCIGECPIFDHHPQLFANSCNACATGSVDYYIPGFCPNVNGVEWIQWMCDGESEPCWGEEESEAWLGEEESEAWLGEEESEAWWEEDDIGGIDDGGDDFIIVTNGETVH